MLENGEVTVGHAKVLLQLKDNEQQALAARRVVVRGLTVRQTEQLVRKMLDPEPTVEPKLPKNYEKVCHQLSENLGTQVSIALKGRSGGVIQIPYNGETELTRLLEIFGVTARP